MSGSAVEKPGVHNDHGLGIRCGKNIGVCSAQGHARGVVLGNSRCELATSQGRGRTHILKSMESTQNSGYSTPGETFTRDTNYINDRIVADPQVHREAYHNEYNDLGPLTTGLTDGAEAWPVQAGRYRLVAARACPCASRTIIVRRLLGLEDAISLGTPGPTHDADSWTFDLDSGGIDPVLGTTRIQDTYF